MAEAKLDVAGCGSMVVDLFYARRSSSTPEQKIALDAITTTAGMERAAGGLVLNHLGWARVLGLESRVGKIAPIGMASFLRRGDGTARDTHHLTTDGSLAPLPRSSLTRAGGRAIYMARGATAEFSARTSFAAATQAYPATRDGLDRNFAVPLRTVNRTAAVRAGQFDSDRARRRSAARRRLPHSRDALPSSSERLGWRRF